MFADLGYRDPQTHQSKAQIVSETEEIVKDRKLTQKAAATVMGISRQDVSRMLNGQFREYSVERLMGFLTLFNRDIEIVVKRCDTETGTRRVTFSGAQALGG